MLSYDLQKIPEYVRKDTGSLSSVASFVESQFSDDEATEQLELSFNDFEKLYEARLVTRSQIKTGRFTRDEATRMRQFLASCPSGEPQTRSETNQSKDLRVSSDGPLVINCGLHRVSPARYRRDYVLRADDSRASNEKKWEVKSPGPVKTQSSYETSTPLRSQSSYEASVASGSSFADDASCSLSSTSDADDGKDQESSFQLPSIKSLLNKFNTSTVDGEETFKRVRTVYWS